MLPLLKAGLKFYRMQDSEILKEKYIAFTGKLSLPHTIPAGNGSRKVKI